MARPKKQTIDYFPHYVTSGKTLYIIESTYGNDGYAFWFKLLEILGSTEGHFYDYNNISSRMFLVAKTRVNEGTAENVLNTLAELDAIDTVLWQRKIIWVQHLVDNIADVYKKRGIALPSKPNFCDRNASTPVVSDTENTQTIVNKTRLNESKPNNNDIVADVSDGVLNTENDNQIPYTDTDEVSGTDPASCSLILDYYCKRSGLFDNNLKPKEIETVTELLKLKIPLDIIYKGIDDAFSSFKPKFNGDKINSFNYCVPIIKSIWEIEKAKEIKGGKQDGTNAINRRDSRDTQRFYSRGLD